MSVGPALVPVAFPTFFRNFDEDLQIIFGSGITLGSLSAILLNIELLRSYPHLGRMAREDETAAELSIPPEQVDALMTVSGLGPESLRERATALVELAKIATFRLPDLVEPGPGERSGTGAVPRMTVA